jgi:uncharacterized membrane-anchored protein
MVHEMYIKSKAAVDKKTKSLARRISPGQIGVICHRDLDELGALSLINAKVKAVINAEEAISGRYPNLGPKLLCEHGIPLIDGVGKGVMQLIKEGDILEIVDNEIYLDGIQVAKGRLLDKKTIDRRMEWAKQNLESELDAFIDNTLEYAKKEKGFILGQLNLPAIDTQFSGKHALIVVRGKDYRNDLNTVQSYIEEVRPILVGVDGGGDALLEYGLIPNIIIGDMDSVSDKALKCCREIIVHAYMDGRAPGMERIKGLGLEAAVLAAPGTSEDIAMLLAYQNGAELIVAVGAHTTMIDFLEKGRRGMGSTFLTRLKIGEKLVDAKGVNKLYKESVKTRHVVGLVLAAMIPIAIVGTMSPPFQQLYRLLCMRLRLIIGM